MRTNGTVPQLTDCGPPRERQHPHASIPTLLVAWDEYLGGTICGRVCPLSTEQNMNHKKENPSLLHPGRPFNVTIQCHCLRPYHSATKSKQTQCNPHHSRPRVLPSCHISSLPHDNYQRGSGPPVLEAPIPMVWSPIKSYIQSGPSLHLTLCAGVNDQAKHQVKY